MAKIVKRLLEGFKPEHYKLSIDPNVGSKKITGTVVISGHKIGKPSKRLTFHQHNLTITSAKINHHGKTSQDIEVTRINHQRSLQEVRLHAKDTLYPGSYEVTLEFTGKINSGMSGVYHADYEDGGRAKTVISTQFESHYARMMMPCIDEPEAKATFDITLHSPIGQPVLGNTLPKSQTEKDGKLVTVFETTPKMSTYLLAFVFGDLQFKEAKTKRGIAVRVWATKAHSPESLDFALDVGVRSIDFFEEYYGIEYPLTKCDNVAVPEFSSGAMENWGLVTYRESALLADPSTATKDRYQRVAQVVIHELSHQWFGNLVTMKWWDGLWLNESFARLMEYVGGDHLFPDWQIWDDFAPGAGLLALRRDALTGVQAVQTDVKHPNEIGSLFDPAIVYAKGGRLLGMLMNYLGQDDFRAGLKSYFNKHAYGNTSGSDLWEAFSTASGKDIAGFMEPWIRQSGFPIVKVTQTGKDLNLSQTHFSLDPDKVDAGRLWPIPVLSAGGRGPELLAAKASDSQLLSTDYLHINQGAIGHYVVHYVNPEHAAAIADLAASKQLSVPERLKLLSDSILLARANQQSFAATLQLLGSYASEDSEPVWGIMAQVIAEARRFSDIDPKLEQPINALTRRLIASEFARLGWQPVSGESVQDAKLRRIVISLGLRAEDPVMLAQAQELFASYKTNPDSITSDLRGAVFGAAVRSKVEGAFGYLLKLDASTQNVDLKADIMMALCKTSDTDQIKTLLDRIKDVKQVRRQDIITWFMQLFASETTQAPAWQWLRDNWDWIEAVYADDKNFDYLPRMCGNSFNTPKLYDEYVSFFEPQTKHIALERTIHLGIHELQTRVAWLERDIAAVKSYFE